VTAMPMPTPADPAIAALAAVPAPPAVAPTSRYATVGVATYAPPGGTPVPYLLRRFIPPPERFTTVGEHRVAAGERLDVITATYLGDPTQFWRLCDANLALRPAELETPERVLRLTLPEGIADG
jgi:hypothetical protein